ncbi:MAG: DUF2934 domain-containing protein [candidate division Zixibacteria bacterium]|nr:DUF2934 domain-containing protein [candidate division Zixibacteria bacterium]
MAKEIKRNNWSRFCKRFSSANQYRRTTLQTRGSADKGSVSVEPFMGVALSKKGRLIDGIQFFSGNYNPDKVVEPVMTIHDPEKIFLDKDDKGRDRNLNIKLKDGTEVTLEISGEPEPDRPKYLTEKIAYSMFENRGYKIGHDLGDWLDAENRVKQAESSLAE